MKLPGLTGEELYTWVERTSSNWQELLTAHPETLSIPCDIRAEGTVADLLKHIVGVELLFAEWLSEIPRTALDPTQSSSVEAIYQTHQKAMSLLRDLSNHDEAWWQETVVFKLRSGKQIHGPRRVFAIHLFMHSIRHYAQLATLIRQHGIEPGWQMDYIGMIMPSTKA
jgi:uncharacterized damage-inducible protein DinB